MWALAPKDLHTSEAWAARLYFLCSYTEFMVTSVIITKIFKCFIIFFKAYRRHNAKQARSELTIQPTIQNEVLGFRPLLYQAGHSPRQWNECVEHPQAIGMITWLGVSSTSTKLSCKHGIMYQNQPRICLMLLAWDRFWCNFGTLHYGMVIGYYWIINPTKEILYNAILIWHSISPNKWVNSNY